MEKQLSAWLRTWCSTHSNSPLFYILEVWIHSLENNIMSVKDAIGILNDCDNEEMKNEMQKILYEGLRNIMKKTAC